METLEALLTRRSIRKYTGKPVTDEQLHTIIRAGFSAPTCANLRPWQFVVLRDPETIKALATHHPGARAANEAGLVIMMCGDSRLHDNEYYVNQDCSAAIENMLLAAHGMGLGGLWTGMYPYEPRQKPMADLVGLPQEVKCYGLVTIGEPAEQKDAPDRYVAERVHFEKW